MQEIPLLYLLIGVFIVGIIIIISLILNTKKSITTFKTTDPEEIKKLMEQHNFPTDMFNNLQNRTAGFTSTKTTRKVKYINGQIVSDETNTSTKEFTTLTNCPNCGATIEEENNGSCKYCNTSFKTYQININK